jgi:hypothetical protein
VIDRNRIQHAGPNRNFPRYCPNCGWGLSWHALKLGAFCPRCGKRHGLGLTRHHEGRLLLSPGAQRAPSVRDNSRRAPSTAAPVEVHLVPSSRAGKLAGFIVGECDRLGLAIRDPGTYGLPTGLRWLVGGWLTFQAAGVAAVLGSWGIICGGLTALVGVASEDRQLAEAGFRTAGTGLAVVAAAAVVSTASVAAMTVGAGVAGTSVAIRIHRYARERRAARARLLRNSDPAALLVPLVPLVPSVVFGARARLLRNPDPAGGGVGRLREPAGRRPAPHN